MTIADIKRYLDHYRHAARCAMKAGFDGCEVHGAHGYLLDQFLQLSSNCTRDDEYSGSLENRSRFMLEAVAAVAEEIGQDKTAIRLSPFSTFQGMSQPVDEPFSTWGYVCESLAKAFPQLAYVSVTDARLGSDQGGSDATKKFTCDPFRAAFRGVTGPISQLSAEATTVFPDPTPEHPTVFFSAGGYTASEAETASERTGDVVAYGRIYLANPDLPHRLKSGLTLNAYDRSTFYTSEKEGYTTYPFASAETPKFVPN